LTAGLEDFAAFMQPHPPRAPKPVVPWAASFSRLSVSSKEHPQLDLELEDLDDEDWSLPAHDAVHPKSDHVPAVTAVTPDEPPRHAGLTDADSRCLTPLHSFTAHWHAPSSAALCVFIVYTDPLDVIA
jgi:hypothetical protein